MRAFVEDPTDILPPFEAPADRHEDSRYTAKLLQRTEKEVSIVFTPIKDSNHGTYHFVRCTDVRNYHYIWRHGASSRHSNRFGNYYTIEDTAAKTVLPFRAEKGFPGGVLTKEFTDLVDADIEQLMSNERKITQVHIPVRDYLFKKFPLEKGEKLKRLHRYQRKSTHWLLSDTYEMTGERRIKPRHRIPLGALHHFWYTDDQQDILGQPDPASYRKIRAALQERKPEFLAHLMKEERAIQNGSILLSNSLVLAAGALAATYLDSNVIGQAATWYAIGDVTYSFRNFRAGPRTGIVGGIRNLMQPSLSKEGTRYKSRST